MVRSPQFTWRQRAGDTVRDPKSQETDMSDQAESKRCVRCGRELPVWELPDVCVRCFLDAADRERTPSGGSRSPS
jgi:ribosomal protein S14